MSDSLRKAFEVAGRLPKREQDEPAAAILKELASDTCWDAALSQSDEALARLADEALSVWVRWLSSRTWLGGCSLRPTYAKRISGGGRDEWPSRLTVAEREDTSTWTWHRGSLAVALMTFTLSFAATGSAAAEPLLVTVDGFCICHASMYVGMTKGIFARHGVDVRLTFPATGFESLKDAAAGTAHVAAAAPAVVAQTRAQGAPLTGIFMAFGDATARVPTDSYLAVVGRKASGIREGHLEDLKGKKIGVPRGTIAHQYFFYAAATKGLDATRDVGIQPTPPANLASALQSGAVDAIVIWEPVAAHAVQTVPDAFVVYRGGNHIQFLDLRVVTPAFLAANREPVKRYIAAFAEAAQYARLHPDEATDIVLKEVKGVSRETVRMALGMLDFDVRISRATAQAARQGFEFAAKIGGLTEIPKFEDMIDLTLFNEVAREHPEYLNDLPPIPSDLKW